MATSFSTDQRISIVKLYYKLENAKEVRRRWLQDSAAPAPTSQAILDLVQKFEQTGSVLDIKRTGPAKSVQTAKLMGDIAASLDRSPRSRQGAFQRSLAYPT